MTKSEYCTRDGDCRNCPLASFGMDCRGEPLPDETTEVKKKKNSVHHVKLSAEVNEKAQEQKKRHGIGSMTKYIEKAVAMYTKYLEKLEPR